MEKIDSMIQRVSASPAFLEATAEELRVLVLLLEDGNLTAEDAARRAKIGKARAESAIAYWRAVFAEGKTGNVVDEFDFRLTEGKLDEITGKDAAAVIRNGNLADLFDECAHALGKPVLTDTEARNVAALYEQYAIEKDFILTLLADMTARGKVTVRSLCDKAIQLYNKEITTVEALSDFIEARENGSEWMRRARRLFGIYSRALSNEEKKHFKKWVEQYGFSDEVLSLAYDKTILGAHDFSLSYMDKILTDWQKAGLFSVEACREYSEAHKTVLPEKTPKKEKKEKPRYGTFDPEETLNKALARSMGEPEKEGK